MNDPVEFCVQHAPPQPQLPSYFQLSSLKAGNKTMHGSLTTTFLHFPLFSWFVCIVICDKVHSFRHILPSRRKVQIPFRVRHSASDRTVVALRGSMRLIEGLCDVADEYDIFLLDMWGVLHDGSKPYEGVLDAIKRLKNAKKRLFILSNSSKRKDNSVRMLTKLGFNPDDFEQIITSGEVAFDVLSGDTNVLWDQPIIAPDKPKNVFVFGSGEQDIEYCNSSGWNVTDLKQSSLVLARGTFTIHDGIGEVTKKDEDDDVYEKLLETRLTEAAGKRLPMLVANPDKVRPDVGRPPMPGKIGDSYEKTLAAEGVNETNVFVKRIGKPFKDVYSIALEGVDNLSRVCMVGDALETDIAGGDAFGINTIWVVMDGIHSTDINAEDLTTSANRILDSFNQKSNTYAKRKQLSPTLVLAHFHW